MKVLFYVFVWEYYFILFFIKKSFMLYIEVVLFGGFLVEKMLNENG